MDELTAELKNGKSAAENVVRHLLGMGAAKATIPVDFDGVAYVVCAHEATLQDPRDARIAALEGEVAALRAQLAAPLRLGRGPTDEEFRRHNTTGGGWLLQGVGEDMGGWTMEMRPIPEADIPAMVKFTKDAIALSPDRQPCRVGEGAAGLFGGLGQKQTSLGPELSATLTTENLWNMYDTGDKETP